MVRTVLLCVVCFLSLVASGTANYYGDPQSDAGWIPKQNEVFHECMRPPCGQGWVAEPAEAIECPIPHTSPVWFSGAVDWDQVGSDVFFGALANGGDGVPTQVKSVKSARTGKIKSYKLAGRAAGGVIAGGVLVGFSIWQNLEEAGYHCAQCLWGEYSQGG